MEREVTVVEIKKIIENAIPDSQAVILDPMNDGEHLQAYVISSTFEGMMLVKQHQLVMQPLKEAFASHLHALALKTFTPQKWDETRRQFGL
jgi:acid stress-induced BolA-like protein IbaG/YrbA